MTAPAPFGTIEAYCASQSASDWTGFPETTRLFLEYLGLPSSHPICDNDSTVFENSQIPPSGPLQSTLLEVHDYNLWETTLTLLNMYAPTCLSFLELSIRILSCYAAPLAIAALVRTVYVRQQGDETAPSKFYISFSSLCAVYMSLINMTDTLYVLEYGMKGLILFAASVPLAFLACKKRQLVMTRALVVLAVIVAFFVTFDKSTNTFHFGERKDVVTIEPGLYYSAENKLLKLAVEKYWPVSRRTYNYENGANQLLLTGDARTLLPYLFNRVVETEWTRVYLQVEDGEVLALDISFPKEGHDFSKPIYLVQHGANSASDAGYAHDLAQRQNAVGSTVIVMIARGYMDLPVLTGNIFHMARISDIHFTASTIRKKAMVSDPDQVLVGMGYSTGAFVLSNYVATSGPDCALDAAFSVSGAFDSRLCVKECQRQKRTWLAMVAHFVRMRHLIKWGERMKAKLSRSAFLVLLRAWHTIKLDEAMTVNYYGKDHFIDAHDYHAKMGPLGDIPIENFNQPFKVKNDTAMSIFVPRDARINKVSIPICNLFALDDPVLSWRFVAAKEGIMRPENIVETGSKNSLLLMTSTGGHVGWPTGWSFQDGWKFVNEAGSSFFNAIIAAKLELKESQRRENQFANASVQFTIE